ncbi:putative proline-specific permease put4 [Talaromyces pinophilus]|nr:putative proline-specific permease put4 [Talaromyces pinophilus]
MVQPANHGDSDCTPGHMDTQSDRFGHVERRLKSRHIQFMALGGAIGTSLFLGIGSSLSTAGPANLLLGFAISGLAVYGMMLSLGEMTTWLPIPGGIPTFCSRYVDDALGFAVGWNNWYFASIVVCLEISAASVVIDYWPGAQGVSPALWITIIIIFIIVLNVSAVGTFGEAEFVFTSIKLIAIIGLMILSVVIMAGGAPNHEAIGFKYWNKPGAMNELSPATGAEGCFLAFFSVLVYACFTYAGVEMLAAAGGETQNPRVNMPLAFRRVAHRIVGFYVFGTLFVGCIVASNDPNLLTALAQNASGAAESPWVIGIQNAGITVLPSIINAVILTSAVSSANAMLYTGSRYLYSLAQVGQAPRVLLHCTKKGVPLWCVLVTASISLLTYMTVSVAGSTVFLWFANLTTVASLITWMSICYAFTRFRAALHAQGMSTENIWFRSPFQPYLAWTCLIFFAIVSFFNGFSVFMKGNWSVSSFLVAYIGFPIFGAFYISWKILKRTKVHPLEDVDLVTEKAEIDALDGDLGREHPKTMLSRLAKLV